MENKNKIPHWRNSSNIKYQNVKKKDKIVTPTQKYRTAHFPGLVQALQ
jgi:hypothetical protein